MSGFDHTDPDVQDLMAGRALEQGRQLGRGFERERMPGLRQAVDARLASDSTSILDDVDDELARAGSPVWGGTGARVFVSAGGGWRQVGGAVQNFVIVDEVSRFADAMQPVAEAFGKLAKQITFTLEQVDVDALWELLGGQTESDAEDSSLSRRRHGHAAVCPRHGPTKGGTCRRCQRGRHSSRF